MAANWDYYIELQEETDQCLDVVHRVEGFTSDNNGHITFDGVFELEPGTYRMNIDVVSNPSDNVPPDPDHREIGGYGYIEITVP